MNNIKKYLLETVSRLKRVKYATSLTSFNNQLCVAVIDSMPNLILDLAGKGKIKKVASKMLSNLTLRIDGSTIKVNDFLAYYIMVDNTEDFMKRYFKPQKGDIVVDVGAHIGKYTIQWAKKVGDSGKVVAIEPKLENYKLLLRNIEVNRLRNVYALNCAAWKRNEILTLFVGDSSAAVSVHAYNYKRSFQVQAVALDELMKDYKRVDWVKIDVEGAEVDVLMGLSGIMHSFGPSLMLEVWSMNYDKVIELLKEHDYTFCEVAERITTYGIWFTQMFAVKKGKLKRTLKRLD